MSGNTGTPEVWVQIQMESTESPFVTVRCGFLGSSAITQVTVSCRGPDGAGGTKLAVLHPEFGSQQWPPARQVRWETRTSISLTMEWSEGRSPSPNTTVCCTFTSFPEGSQEACGNHLLNSDPGLAATSPDPILRADLAGILGASGVLLFGCIYLLHLLHRQRHWSVTKPQPSLSSPQTQTGARAASQVSLASFHTPYATVTTNYCPATLDTVLPPQHCLGGCHSPPTRHANLPRGHLCQPLLEAVSSPSRMDSMLRQERGLPTLAPTLSLSLTV
uniref:Transmembrane protein PVRIG immunoglobulin-like domain-containing protein n=1 Tax=Rhinolophus ferrumequinum TaxID=59479 RepID=A0A671DZL0_RHIFE